MGRMKEEYYSMPFIDRLKFLESDYRSFFEQAEIELGGKATVLDYHNLYLKVLNERILNGGFLSAFEFMYEAKNEDQSKPLTEKDPVTNTYYLEVVKAYEKEKKKLDDVFNEFTGKIEKHSDMQIKNFPKDATDKDKEILNKLSELYLIRPVLQKNGKYKMTNKKNSRQIIEIILKNNNLNDTGAYFFFDTFIEYDVLVSSIKRFINDIHFEIEKNRNRIKTDKTG
jgi:hypothetical protein